MKSFVFFCLLVGLAAVLPISSLAQSRDYLTDEEVEIIREAQQIDNRIEVLVHMIDRRLAVLGTRTLAEPVKGRPRKEKEDVWGPPPTGTRLQLLNDIKRILQKAIDDIDNISERPDSMVIDPDAEKENKKVKGFADLFPKAVRSLSSAATRYQPILKADLDKTTDNMEKGIILDTIDMCDQIIAAGAKLPDEMKKQKEKH